MYAQQYRQPPKDYGGTAILQDMPEEKPAEAEPEAKPAPAKSLLNISTDELIIAVLIFMVISGGWEKNSLVLLALVFILL